MGRGRNEASLDLEVQQSLQKTQRKGVALK